MVTEPFGMQETAMAETAESATQPATDASSAGSETAVEDCPRPFDSQSLCPAEAFLPEVEAAAASSASTVDEPSDVCTRDYLWDNCEAYDYSYRDSEFTSDGCQSSSTLPTTPAVAEVVVSEIPEIDTRDYEDECYQAWLQRRADETLAVAPANEQPALETENGPFDAYGYEYRYDGYATECDRSGR